MTDPLQEVYIQLIEIQKSILESQASVHHELNEIKKCVGEKFNKLEEKVNHHETIFSHVSRVLTWIIPSGSIVALAGWIFTVIGHK